METRIDDAPKKDRAPTDGKLRDLITAVKAACPLFHDEVGRCYAYDGTEALDLDSAEFDEYLCAVAVKQNGLAPSEATKKIAIATLKVAARKGPCEEVFLRVGEKGGNLYYDYGVPDKNRGVAASGAAIEVRPGGGWSVVAQSPIYFRRCAGMLAYPRPEAGGHVDELRMFLNVGQGDDGQQNWILVLLFLLACLRPRGPFPLLQIVAGEGRGKTMLARIINGLVDPSAVPVCRLQKPSDVVTAVIHTWLVAFDNVSKISQETSDLLCGLLTGTGNRERRFHTNNQQVLVQAYRAVLITALTNVVSRKDLASRVLIVQPPPISPSAAKTEAELYAEFSKVEGRVFGALLDAVSCALARVNDVNATELPRLADMAKWAIAAEPALGLRPGEVQRALGANTSSAVESIVDDSPLAAAIQEYAELPQRKERISPTELLRILSESKLITADIRRQPSWPSTASRLKKAIEEIEAGLKKQGVEIVWGRSNGKRWVEVNLLDEAPGANAAPTEKGNVIRGPFAVSGDEADMPEAMREFVKRNGGGAP